MYATSPQADKQHVYIYNFNNQAPTWAAVHAPAQFGWHDLCRAFAFGFSEKHCLCPFQVIAMPTAAREVEERASCLDGLLK